MSLTTEELNFLLYRYLQESGFRHTAFCFAHESLLYRSNIDGERVPPGALISVVQRGLQYLELEAQIRQEIQTEQQQAQLQQQTALQQQQQSMRKRIKSEVTGPASAAAAALQQQQQQQQQNTNASSSTAAGTSAAAAAGAAGAAATAAAAVEGGIMVSTGTDVSLNMFRDVHPPPALGEEPASTAAGAAGNGSSSGGGAAAETNGGAEGDALTSAAGAAAAAAAAEAAAKLSKESFADYQVHKMIGHSDEVLTVMWNPKRPSQLATGSGDATVRLWSVPEVGQSGSSTACLTLPHAHTKEVATVDWHPEGILLATGDRSGRTRIFTADGSLQRQLGTKGVVFQVRFSPLGDTLLSAGRGGVFAYDVQTGNAKQFYAVSDLVLDVDWRNNGTFAMAGTDKKVHICTLTQPTPIKSFAGHLQEINCIRWNDGRGLIASASDDAVCRVWNYSSGECVQALSGHEKGVYTCRWCPEKTHGSWLATAGYDGSVLVWDIESGSCLYKLEDGNTQNVYSVAFHPNGELVAFGSFDGGVRVCSLQDGSVVRRYTGTSSVYEIAWTPSGDRLAASCSDGVVCVLDYRA